MKFNQIVVLTLMMCTVSMQGAIALTKRYQIYFSCSVPSYRSKGPSCSKKEVERQKKIFGYDLSITHMSDLRNQIENNDLQRIKLFVHGYANNYKQAYVIGDLYKLLPGDFASFNLPDYAAYPPLIPQSHKSHFGQLKDVLPMLYTMNYLRSTLGLSALDLYGFSRGGAVVVNALAVLCDSTGRYDEALQKIGIDADARRALIDLIKNGSVVIHSPITNANVILKKRFMGLPYKMHASLSYDPNGLQPLKSAQSLDSTHQFKVLVHFQHKDESVLNHKEADLYNAFARNYPEHTYLVMGNDGGHNEHPKSLGRVIDAFYQSVGAAYDPRKVSQHVESHANLVQPATDKAEQYIASFHASCEDEPKAKN